MKKSNSDYNKLKSEITLQHNVLRSNPKSYIPLLENQIKLFEGKILQRPGEVDIMTNEGKTAYEECIQFLKNQKALGKLTYDEALAKAAQDHSNDIGSHGMCGHTGSDNSDTDMRISKYVEWDVSISENIDFGSYTAEDILISLIVDDGVKDRGHRKNIFNTDMKFVGIGISPHTSYEICTVLNYSGGIISYVNTKSQTLKGSSSSSDFTLITNMKKDIFIIKDIARQSKLKNLFDKKNNSDLCNEFSNKNKISEKKNKVEDLKEKSNVEYIQDDPDAPKNAVSVSVKTVTKKKGKKTVTNTTKTYSLDDGSTEILEIEEVEE